MKLRLLIGCLWIVLTTQAQQPSYRNITDENGLPSSEVYSVFEDRNGFLWFMTDNGVVRFDGAEYQSFGKGEGLADPVAFEMIQDSRDRLWVRGFAGTISVYDNGKFSPYRYNAAVSSLSGKSMVRSFVVDDHGKLFFSSGSGVIATIDSAGKVDAFQVQRNTFFYKNITGEQGLLCAPGTPGRIKYFQTGSQRFPMPAYDSIENNSTISYRWWNHKLYLSMDHYLYEYDQGSFRVVLQTEAPIISLSLDAENTFWVGFLNAGVWRFTSQNFASHEEVQSLIHSSVTSVHRDREGGYWFSTLNRGVYYYPNMNLKSFPVIIDSKLSAFARMKDRILVGFYNGQVESIDRQFRQAIMAHLLGPVTAIHPGASGQSWVSTSAQTYFLDSVGNEIKRFPKVKGIKKFVEKGNIVWGVNYFGVHKFSRQGELLGRIPTKFWTRNILVTDQYIYLAGVTGLYRTDHALTKLDTIRQLKNGKVSDLLETTDGCILASTMGDGLFVLKKDSVWSYNRSNQFPTNDILSIKLRGDELWLGMPQGLLQLSLSALLERKEWEFNRLDRTSGLHGGGVSHIEFLDGNVWAFNANSFSVIDMQECHFATKEVKFYPKLAKVNGGDIRLAGGEHLNYQENNVELDFGFIAFNNRDIFIRHRPNRESEWSVTSHGPINYFALAPGRYGPEIEYSLDRRHWQKAGMVRNFVINQAWYKSIWAALAGLALMTAFIRYIYGEKFKRKVEKMEFQQRLKQERERISRDLHDNIGSRLATISLVFDKVIKENSISNKNTEFVANGLNLAMVELRDTIWAIEQERISITEFSNKIKDLLWRLRQNEIAINIDFETENLTESEFVTSTQAVNLFRIVQEALTNCMKHSKASTIFIKLSRQESGLHFLAVQDNGSGFVNGQTISGHYGMRNMKGRAEEIGAELLVDSEPNLGTTVAVRFAVSK